MNGDRHNGYGGRPTTAAMEKNGVLASTRKAVAEQPPAAPFTTAPATQHKRCTRCGNVNPTRAMSCRRCGEGLA